MFTNWTPMWDLADYYDVGDDDDCDDGKGSHPPRKVQFFLTLFKRGGGHNGRKSLILAPQEIPDISGYQWGFGCQFVKAYITENPVTNQKIL